MSALVFIKIFWVSEHGSESEVSSDLLWPMRISKRAEMNSDLPTSPLYASQLRVWVWTNSAELIRVPICSNSSLWLKNRRIWRISDKLYPFHIPQFLLYVNQLLWLPPTPEFRHLKKGAYVVAKKPWCLAGHPHVFKPPPWGWCKPGELPSGNAMDLCSCRESGLPSTLPHCAVVSSHGQTGSILSPVVDSPKSITLVSSVEIDALRNWVQLKWIPSVSVSAFAMPVLVQPTQKGGLYGLYSFELFIPRFGNPFFPNLAMAIKMRVRYLNKEHVS